MSNKRFIIQHFRFPKIMTCQGFYLFRNETSTNIVWYLFSFHALFVLYETVLIIIACILFTFRLPTVLFDSLWYCIISLCSFCHHFLSCFEDRISPTRSGEGHCKMLDNAVITNDIFWKYVWKQITDSFHWPFEFWLSEILFWCITNLFDWLLLGVEDQKLMKNTKEQNDKAMVSCVFYRVKELSVLSDCGEKSILGLLSTYTIKETW